MQLFHSADKEDINSQTSPWKWPQLLPNDKTMFHAVCKVLDRSTDDLGRNVLKVQHIFESQGPHKRLPNLEHVIHEHYIAANHSIFAIFFFSCRLAVIAVCFCKLIYVSLKFLFTVFKRNISKLLKVFLVGGVEPSVIYFVVCHCQLPWYRTQNSQVYLESACVLPHIFAKMNVWIFPKISARTLQELKIVMT